MPAGVEKGSMPRRTARPAKKACYHGHKQKSGRGCILNSRKDRDSDAALKIGIKGHHTPRTPRTRRRATSVIAALQRVRFSLAVLVLFVVLAVVSGFMLRNTLLRNAYESNTALSRFYASETDSTLKTYEVLLDFGAASIEARGPTVTYFTPRRRLSANVRASPPARPES